MKKLTSLALLLTLLCTLFGGCVGLEQDSFPYESSPIGEESRTDSESSSSDHIASVDEIPAYEGKIYVAVNDNNPYFTDTEITTEAYEFYSELDALGRCGFVMACIGRETMPTQDRGDIGHVYPSGWEQARYDIVDGGYLYNRSHLIGWQLTAENDNEKNLITGTRYFNVEGMLPFENMVADYIKETEHHVMYRVTPIFKGKELVCRGVLIEAYSAEDRGEELSFCVFVYNVQPGVFIDYATGESRLAEDSEIPNPDTESESDSAVQTQTKYILNTSSKKYHKETCSYATSMSEANRQEYTGDPKDLPEGYTACGVCKPE